MTCRVQILNGAFDAVTLSQAVEAVFNMVDSGHRGWVATVNVSTLIAMRHDPGLQQYVDRAALVVADGQPLVWCAGLFDGHLPQRVAGIDLAYRLCERAAATGTGVYLLGSTSKNVGQAVLALQLCFPLLRISGADGYFSPASAPERAADIQRSRAKILLVGMGSPRQELFIETQWQGLGATVAIGVGGSFDVIAGARRRAYPLVQQLGLEWVVRLSQEPRRLLPRYLRTNAIFFRLILQQIGARINRARKTPDA